MGEGVRGAAVSFVRGLGFARVARVIASCSEASASMPVRDRRLGERHSSQATRCFVAGLAIAGQELVVEPGPSSRLRGVGEFLCERWINRLPDMTDVTYNNDVSCPKRPTDPHGRAPRDVDESAPGPP